MIEQEWLIDESVAEPVSRGTSRESASIPEPINLAIRLQDIFIWDTKKWFGDAEMRLDALVVHGNATEGQQASTYTPQTFRFPGVKSGDRLPTGENGLLIFYGQALHFLDIFITVSRDRKDSDDLATLLNEQLQSKEFQGATATLLGLAIAAPQVATVTGAMGAATVLGNLTYQALRKVTSDTVGLYRTSWLQNRDNFGIGRHPKRDVHLVKDLSFWYEIIKE
ncbi:hypothetical protein NIES4071_53030 [Calothrix sp. NIES-4071]|nr:hypothetical protein NIES4071_53030 [Calothrix sp. NIES-4071]BAZ59611.1 hypothetical protein NIES4105_52980 [Calothrix sp. NIES-4105]